MTSPDAAVSAGGPDVLRGRLIEAAAKALSKWDAGIPGPSDEARIVIDAVLPLLADAMEADRDRDQLLTHRVPNGHWLIWREGEGFREGWHVVTGCACGFKSDTEASVGYGDDVLDHFQQIVHAEDAALIRGALDDTLTPVTLDAVS